MAADRLTLKLDHSKLRPALYEGVYIPEGSEPLSEHMPKVKDMNIRDDDVLLCTFPKSGTHWLYRVLDMIQRGKAEYTQRHFDSTFLDAQSIELITELTSPRVLATHLPFDLLPHQVKDKRTKIVHMYRNPKAVLVSFYFMMNAEALQGNTMRTIDRIGQYFLSERMVYRGWLGYQAQVSQFERENPSHPLFHVSYEDMTRDPEDVVSRLSRFLGIAMDPDLCSEIVKACSFKTQKEREESLNCGQTQMNFYRKGDVDDWKNHMTVDLDEKLDAILRKRADSCPVTAKYCGSSSQLYGTD